MKRILKIDEKLKKISKPTLQSNDDFILGEKDILVLCAGFEDRATAFLSKVIDNGKQKKFSVLIITYLPIIQENRGDALRSLCKQHNIRNSEVQYDREHPSGEGELISDFICDKFDRVFVDISAMSRLLIIQIIVGMGKSKRGFVDKFVIYSEAEIYPPSKEEVDKNLQEGKAVNRSVFLSSGVFDIVVLPELASLALQGQPILLITFPSFNVDQLSSLRSEVQPSKIILIHGIPPYEEYLWRPKAIRQLNHIDEVVRKEDYESSTLNYKETLNDLLEIYSKYGEMNRIVVSPTGSKMQAIAVGIFKTFMDDIQIVYPTPREFKSPTSYTLGVRKIYKLSLCEFNGLDLVDVE